MSQDTPEWEGIFLATMAKLRQPVIASIVLILLVLLTITSLIAVHCGQDGWKTAGNIGIVLFPAFIGAWSIADTVAKSREEAIKEQQASDSLNRALGPIGQRLKEIANTPESEWSPTRVKDQRERVLETIRALVQDTGALDPRVCLYKVNLDAENTDEEGNQSSVEGRNLESPPTIDVLSYVVHRGGTTPKDLYLRHTDRERQITYTSRRNRVRSQPQTESNCAGLFEPVESRNPTRENSRCNYDESTHHWRSSVRFPVLIGRDVDHLLTIDTAVENGLSREVDKLAETGAVILQLLTSVVDRGLPSEGVGEILRKRMRG